MSLDHIRTNKRQVFILASRRRHGTLQECMTLKKRIAKAGINAKVVPLLSSKSRSTRLKSLLASRPDLVIIYNLHPVITALAILLRLRGAKVLWQCHEPNGYAQKRINNGAIYSLLATGLEYITMRASHAAGTPSQKNAAEFNLQYLPLQYQLTVNQGNVLKTGVVGYLGRKDATRSYGQFRALNRFGLMTQEFPRNTLKTELHKRSFLNECDVIINVYRRRHAQSGVTPDALSYKKMILVSEFDNWATLDWGGAVIQVPSTSTAEEMSRYIRNALSQREGVKWERFSETFDAEFGEASFNETWLPAIYALLSKP